MKKINKNYVIGISKETVLILEYSASDTYVLIDRWDSGCNCDFWRYGSKDLTKKIKVDNFSSLKEFNNYIKENNDTPNESGNGYTFNWNVSSTYLLHYYSGSTGVCDKANAQEKNYFFWDSSIPIKLRLNEQYTGIKVNDRIYKKDDVMPVFSRLNKYTENYRISTKDIQDIVYTFQIPNDKMFTFEFNFSTTWYHQNATLDTFIVPYFSYSKDSLGVTEILKMDRYNLVQEGSVAYYDTQINVFREGSSNMKFVVPLTNQSNLDNSEILIHFDSDYPFTREIVYTSSETPDPIPPVPPDDNINDTITDDSIDTSHANDFFGSFNDKDHGGISAVITAPLTAINKITDKCQPLNFTIYEKEIAIPCGDALFWNREDVSSFRTIWNMLLGGAIIYGLVLKLRSVIDNLKNPDDSRVEVMKL